MTIFSHEIGDVLIVILSYIELSSFNGSKLNYDDDVSEYVSLVKSIARLIDYHTGPIDANVKLDSDTDLIYLGLTSKDKITYNGDNNMHHILISDPFDFLTRSLSQLKKKI